MSKSGHKDIHLVEEEEYDEQGSKGLNENNLETRVR